MSDYQVELEAWKRRYTERLRDQADARQIAAGAKHQWSADDKPAVVPVDDPLPDYDTPTE